MTRMRGRTAKLVAVGVAVVAVALGAALFALGGGSEGCGTGYPSTPECLAEAFVTREDASKCDLVEPKVLEGIMRVRGPEARERCARTVTSRPAPDDFDIVEREAMGDTVVVEFLAGGDEGSVTTRRVGGKWMIVSFAE